MKHYVYLAGPISGLTYEGATDWRALAAQELNTQKVECLSPMRGKQFLAGQGPLAKAGFEANVMSTSKGVNRRDFFDCNRADCLLINFIGAKTVSIGTTMEIAWAYANHTPIVCVMEPDNVHSHCMVNDCITYRVDTLAEGIGLIKYLFNE